MAYESLKPAADKDGYVIIQSRWDELIAAANAIFDRDITYADQAAIIKFDSFAQAMSRIAELRKLLAA